MFAYMAAWASHTLGSPFAASAHNEVVSRDWRPGKHWPVADLSVQRLAVRALTWTAVSYTCLCRKTLTLARREAGKALLESGYAQRTELRCCTKLH